jgi:hypothetical protein
MKDKKGYRFTTERRRHAIPIVAQPTRLLCMHMQAGAAKGKKKRNPDESRKAKAQCCMSTTAFLAAPIPLPRGLDAATYLSQPNCTPMGKHTDWPAPEPKPKSGSVACVYVVACWSAYLGLYAVGWRQMTELWVQMVYLAKAGLREVVVVMVTTKPSRPKTQ